MNKQMSKIRRTLKYGYLALFVAVGAMNSPSLSAENYDEQSDQAMQWVEKGKVLPFEALMKRHSQQLKGRLLDLEIEEEGGRTIYELELLRHDSIVYKIKIDAQNGEWLTEEIED